MTIRSRFIILNTAIALLTSCSSFSDIKLPAFPSSAPVTVEVRQPTITPAPVQPTAIATATALPATPVVEPTQEEIVIVPTAPPVQMDVQNDFWAVTSEQAVLFENRTVNAGDVYETNVELGEVAQAAFNVYSLKEVQFKVIAPNGQVIDPAFVSAYPNYGSLNASAGTPNGETGRTYQYIINAPQEGQWKLSVASESTTPVGMVVSINSPLMLRFTFDKPNYQPGEKVRLEGNIEYRSAVIKRGVSVEAELVLPDHPPGHYLG